MFINVSNYPSSTWSKEQTAAASKYGEIYDIPFPKTITGSSSVEDIDKLAKEYLDKILALKPKAVFVGGEWCFSFALITALLRHNILVLAARSRRDAIEKKDANGIPTKMSTYRFKHYLPIRLLED